MDLERKIHFESLDFLFDPNSKYRPDALMGVGAGTTICGTDATDDDGAINIVHKKKSHQIDNPAARKKRRNDLLEVLSEVTQGPPRVTRSSARKGGK